MRTVLYAAAAVVLGASAALAQNHTPPAGSANAMIPPTDQGWSPANPYGGNRLIQGRSVYEGRHDRALRNEQ